MKIYSFFFLLLFFLLAHNISSEFQFLDQKLGSLYIERRDVNLFSPSGSNEEHSFINFDLRFDLSNPFPLNSGISQIIVVQGLEAVEKVGPCNESGQLELPSELSERFWVKNINWIKNAKYSLVAEKFFVKKTDRHYILFPNCLSSTVSPLIISGTLEIRNPYGYLPGELYGFLPFYGVVCIILVIVLIVWVILNICYKSELLPLQHVITFVMIMTLMEMLVWYYDYYSYNDVGVRSLVGWIIGIILSSFRRSVCRMLVIAVSLGFGVVRPHLDRSTIFSIFALGFVYFGADMAYQLVGHYGPSKSESPILHLLVTLPVAMLDGIWYFWIFSRLSGVLRELLMQKQMAKLRLYQRFSRLLVFSLLAALVFGTYQMVYISKQHYDTEWGIFWFVENGFWNGLYIIILFVILALWRPSSHSKQYAYSQEIASDENDDLDDLEIGPLPSSELPNTDLFSISGDDHETENERLQLAPVLQNDVV